MTELNLVYSSDMVPCSFGSLVHGHTGTSVYSINITEKSVNWAFLKKQ